MFDRTRTVVISNPDHTFFIIATKNYNNNVYIIVVTNIIVEFVKAIISSTMIYRNYFSVILQMTTHLSQCMDCYCYKICAANRATCSVRQHKIVRCVTLALTTMTVRLRVSMAVFSRASLQLLQNWTWSTHAFRFSQY